MAETWKKITGWRLAEWRILLTVIWFFGLTLAVMPVQTEAVLNCSITSNCDSPNITLLRMSSTTNAHVAIGTSSDYGNLVCCEYISSLTNACSGSGIIQGIVNLSSTTNAHVETSSLANYPIKACLRVASGGSIASAVKENNCTGYDDTIASMSSTTNAHMGGPNDYIYKICASAASPPQSLSFTLDWENSIGFGQLSPAQTKWIDEDGNGVTSDDRGNMLEVATNAEYGYVLTVRGDTLKSGANAITAIGASPTAPSVGSRQFGLAVEASGGSGTSSYPYIYGDGYAYAATATTTSEIGRATTGDGVTTNFYIHYIANISSDLPPGTYSTVLTYVVTANY